MTKSYARDISKEKFEEIRLLLQNVRRRTKPTTVDLYGVFYAVLYLLHTGCQWRFLPREFPNWRTVHSYFAKWSESDQDGVSVLEWALCACARFAAGARFLRIFLLLQNVRRRTKPHDCGPV